MSGEAMQSRIGHQGIPPIRILPLQVARLKKEEEEKPWISDEDLYTEGSSDEENCKCYKEKSSGKPSNQSSLVSSATTITTATTALDNPHQLRPKPKRSKSSRSSDSLLAVQSTSRCSRESSRSSIASDEETELMEAEEEEDIADEEISWKVNRETLIMEDKALQDYQQEYPEVCNSMYNIFEEYFNTLKARENMCNENFKRQKEKLQGEINNVVQFFDAVIGKLHSEIECIKQKTRQVQLQNRMRLTEIIKQGPRESKRLAQNTKNFFDLVDDEELKNLPDVTSCTTFDTYENSDSQYSQVKRTLKKLLDATDTTRESFSSANSTKSIIKS